MSGRRCPIKGCGKGRAQGHAMCRSCWASVPLLVKQSYFATRPYSDERRAALLEIYRAMEVGA